MKNIFFRHLSPRLFIISICFALLGFSVMTRIWFDYLTGGNGWRQGDWLINYGSGLVRRGAFGEFFIWLGDLTGQSPLVVVLLTQAALFALTALLAWLILLMFTDRLMPLFLAASPAFFLFFWAAESEGIMRKEILGFLSFLMLLLSCLTGGRSKVLLAVVASTIFALACFGNILHSLLAPAMVLALYWTYDQQPMLRSPFGVMAGIVLIAAIVSFAFAVVFPEVSDFEAICAPLIERGLGQNLCDDALRWLVTGKIDHIAEVTQRLTAANLVEYALVVPLAVLPIILSFRVFAQTRVLTGIIAITFLPMLPLYMIATDWGRWLSISYSFFVFLALIAILRERLSVIRQPSRILIAAMLIVSSLIAHEVSIGWRPGGAAFMIAQFMNDYR